jgi:signal peptidase I
MVDIEDTTQTNYGDNSGGIVREDTPAINIGIYIRELESKEVEINRGDIIEYNPSGEKARYYEVEYAQNVTDASSQTIGNFKPYYKNIKAVPVKEDITQFLKGDELK